MELIRQTTTKMKYYLLQNNSMALYTWNVRYNELMRVANDMEKNFDYRLKALKLAIRMNNRLKRSYLIPQAA